MSLQDLLSIAGSVLIALGGGSLIVFALAKWLGGVWAGRILENEKAREVREQELLVRRRNAYAKLAVALRVFLRREGESWDEGGQVESNKFHEAYDEAALWAPDEVMNSVGRFLDLIKKLQDATYATSAPGAPDPALQSMLLVAYAECITSMRRDCGFPATRFKYRIIHF